MENPDTLILNLTFLGTVGVAFLMFLVLFLLGAITLVLAGVGRLAAVVLMALLGKRRDWGAALKPAHLKSTLRTAVGHHPALAAARREPPVLAKDWAAAVADADARAMARARAARPEIRLLVRDVPDPQVPAEKVAEVAPLVESALDNSSPAREKLRSFRKPKAPHPLAPLDTGSLASLTGPPQLGHASQAAREAEPNGSGPKGKQPLP